MFGYFLIRVPYFMIFIFVFFFFSYSLACSVYFALHECIPITKNLRKIIAEDGNTSLSIFSGS